MPFPKIKVFPGEGEDADFYWHLVGKNGEIQCQGEGYTERNDAVEGALAAGETFLALAGVVVEPAPEATRKALMEGVEIIEADGGTLTLEEAGYGAE